MKDVPGIASAKGVFDIFIPGAFLLIHVIALIGTSGGSDAVVGSGATVLTSNSLLAIAAFVCFGYLMGVLLRLLKTETADRLSGHFCSFFTRKRWPEGQRYLTEEFPYFGYLEDVACHRLSPDECVFFRKVWLPRAAARGNRQFFNHCKIIINAVDERSGAEALAAEAMTRYVSSMFYALCCCFVLVLAMLVISPSVVLAAILGAYLTAIFIILRNLRLLRFKEAEAVFSATYHNHAVGRVDVDGNWRSG